jgi:hypothetical protein
MPTSEPIPASSLHIERAGQPASAAPIRTDAETTIADGAIALAESSSAMMAPHPIKPSFSREILRPDDLLTLRVDGYNLALPGAGHPGSDGQLARIDPSADAFLAFTFPPQHVAEQAYFETYDISPKDRPDSMAGKPNFPSEPHPPGESDSRMSGPSRLVFRLPDGVNTVPFSTEGLLDWSQLEPALAPLAQMPERPTPAQVAAAPPIERPGALVTAIELPYRLFLSPGQDALWQHAVAPVAHAGRTELWHTRMVLPAPIKLGEGKSGHAVTRDGSPEPVGGGVLELTAQQTAPLRAIWSPDYAPPTQQMPTHKFDSTPFLSSLTPMDRHQIVVLTSAFSGYAYDPGAQPFVPSPIHAQRVMLSSLGGWLSSRGAWDHQPYSSVTPAGAPIVGKSKATSIWSGLRDVIVWPVRGVLRIFRPQSLTYSRTETGTASWLLNLLGIAQHTQDLDMSEWVHLATQGRDHYVKVVYEGHLLPFGHRAALIKITERKFQTQVGGPLDGAPVAWLRQHMYVVVREPEKRYDDAVSRSYTSDGRAMPLKSIRLKTLVTPDIVYPYDDGHTPNSQVNGTKGSYWIQVNRGGKPTDFAFSVSANDLEDRSIEFTTPMLFVSLADSRDASALKALRDAYNPNPNKTAADDERRTCVVAGQKVAFAPPSSPGKGDTDLTTSRLYFDLIQLLGDPAVPAGFVPLLEQATVSVPALEHLLGNKAPVHISLAQAYLDHDLDGHAGVFAQLDTSTLLPVTFNADQAGGISTPNLTVTGLSRALGPVAGQLADVVSGAFKPDQYFPDAKLFGVVNLMDLVTRGGDLTTQAPTIVTTVDTAAKQAVTTMHWVPTVAAGKHGPGGLLVTGEHKTTTLTIDEHIVKPLSEGPAGSFDLSGSLTYFALNLAGVLKIEFDSFSFSSRSHEKPHVAVALAPTSPIKFEGPLEFVNQLSEVIPAGVFGDSGPSLSVTPSGVQVGYRLGLPPLQVAVFALHSVTLAAALDLPFESGKPQLDFSFSRRHDPFILTIEALGGGGFLHLILDAAGVIMAEGSLEFGGEFALDIGVASGGVHIMGGVYFQLKGKDADLSGFVDVAGEVSVLGIVSVSVDFNLSLSYIDQAGAEKKVQGRATLTVEVHVAFFSKSVDMEVERSYGSNGGDPTIGDVLTEDDWNAYAAAFAA